MNIKEKVGVSFNFHPVYECQMVLRGRGINHTENVTEMTHLMEMIWVGVALMPLNRKRAWPLN